AQPGQEHLHLLRGRVLRLGEEDERVVEGPTPHERARRDLDDPPVHQPRDDFGLEHVVEGVVQRPEIRVDLGEDVAGEKAQSLPRLDRRARQDDPVALLRLKEALLLRLQLAGPNGTLLTAAQYNELFTMHGTTMIFLMG